MSRHKNVRNLDLDEELDDYDAYDGEQSGMTESEERQMRASLQSAREVLGNDIPGLTDRDIEESLWYYYFDVLKTVNYILSKYSKSQASAKPKEKPKEKQKTKKGTLGVYGSPRTAMELGYFLDTPWGCVPPDRTATLVPHGPRLCGGLLGGAPPGKESKLAALARARKEKKAAAPTGEQGTSLSLLSRLAPKKLSETLVDKEDVSAEVAAETPPQDKSRSVTKEELPVSEDAGAEQSSPAPEEAREDADVFMLQEEPAVPEPPPALKAVPSSFAQSMFGERIAATFKITLTDGRMFNITGNPSKEKSEAFAQPSPDDIVTAAQNKSGGAPKQKNEQTDDADTAAEKLDSLKVDATPPPPRKAINVLEEYRSSQAKENINLVVVGHVDAGKSTLMGRLLYDCGNVEERAMRKFKQEAAQLGKSSFALAWVLDQTEEERSRGVTMDIATNKFETEKACFTILDAPGHRDFVPNMIAGASQADFAVLVIDASTGAFESGFHLRGQTKEHTLLVRSMGVQRIVVAVNKLDTVNWSQDRFEEIQQQITQFLTNAGFLEKNISFVPCSGLEGINVIHKPAEGSIPWYQGPTLIEELESSQKLNRALDKPLRLTISDVFRGGIQNPVSVSGRIDSGYLQEGDTLLCMPSGETATIKSLAVDEDPAKWAVAGHNVILHLAGVDSVHLKSGDVLCTPENPITNVKSFKVKLLAFESLTPMMVDIHKGRLHAPGRISAMHSTIDKATGNIIKKKPRHVSSGSLASVSVEVTGDVSIPLEAGNRVVLRSNGQTVAAGIVE